MPHRHLTTKLLMPPLRQRWVVRSELVGRIERGVEAGRRLTLLSAPAGFGKTTLVGMWLAASGRAAAWLSLDEADNDPARFLEHLGAAFQTVAEGVGRDVLRALQTPQPPSPLTLTAALCDDMAASEQALTLVLDDYHLIRSAAVHGVVAFLLDHQPPNLHLVISTREDPPLVTPKLRARAQLTELGQQNLRFGLEESALFFEQTMRLALEPSAVATLHDRTEGWIAGLQLAALALAEDPRAVEVFVARFSGSDRFIVDYLVAEVLKRQPEDVRTFLLRTAVLERLCGSLCDALTGRSDGQRMLEHLDRVNLFIVPLDRERAWFRYHRLFAESLRGFLSADEPLHERAALWHETQGMVRQALHHALVYSELAGDFEAVKRLLPRAADEALRSGELQTVLAWFDAVPKEEVHGDAGLAVYLGWALALSGELEPAETYALEVQRVLEGGASQATLGLALVLRSYIAILRHQDYDAARELATRAQPHLGAAHPQWRGLALWTVAEAQERTTHILEAITTLREAQATKSEDNQLYAAAIDNFLASALNHHGQRREAVDVCLQALARYTEPSGHVSPLAGIVLSRLGLLCYEANDLERSREHVDRGLALSQQLGLEGQLSFSFGVSAFPLVAQGELDKAAEALQTAHRLAQQTGLSDPGVFLAWEANLRLTRGDLPFARRWARAAGLSPDNTPLYLRFDDQLVYARLLLAQGRTDTAAAWLRKLEDFAESRGLRRWKLTVHMLQALTAERTGDRFVVRENLARAVDIAAPEGYYRAFLDEDPRLLASLPAVRYVAPVFVDRLLRYADAMPAKRSVSDHPVVAAPTEAAWLEPLSPRELEVLALLAAGYSNRESARKLGITPGTVKRHAQNIYGKLGVHSRTQAVAKGRALDLI